jgi:hypothetical protein
MPVQASFDRTQIACQKVAEAYLAMLSDGKDADPYDSTQDAVENTLRLVYLAAYVTDTPYDNQDDRIMLWEATLEQLTQLTIAGEDASIHSAHHNSVSYLLEQKKYKAQEDASANIRAVLDDAHAAGLSAQQVLTAINQAISDNGSYSQWLPLAPVDSLGHERVISALKESKAVNPTQ